VIQYSFKLISFDFERDESVAGVLSATELLDKLADNTLTTQDVRLFGLPMAAPLIGRADERGRLELIISEFLSKSGIDTENLGVRAEVLGMLRRSASPFKTISGLIDTMQMLKERIEKIISKYVIDMFYVKVDPNEIDDAGPIIVKSHPMDTASMASNSDGSILVAGGRYFGRTCHDTGIKIFDVEKGEVIYKTGQRDLHNDYEKQVVSVDASRDGSLIVFARRDNTGGIVRKVGDSFELTPWDGEHGDILHSVATNGSLIAIVNRLGVKVIDTDQNEIFTLTEANGGHSKENINIISSVAISQNGKTMVSGDSKGNIFVTDLQSKQVIWKYKSPRKNYDSWINSIAISDNSRFAVFGENDGAVEVLDLVERRVVATFDKENDGHAEEVMSVDMSSDGRYVVSGSWDNSVRFYDISSGDVFVIDKNKMGPDAIVKSVAISGDGSRIFYGDVERNLKAIDILDLISELQHKVRV